MYILQIYCLKVLSNLDKFLPKYYHLLKKHQICYPYLHGLAVIFLARLERPFLVRMSHLREVQDKISSTCSCTNPLEGL
jgi:hypothetical protein